MGDERRWLERWHWRLVGGGGELVQTVDSKGAHPTVAECRRRHLLSVCQAVKLLAVLFLCAIKFLVLVLRAVAAGFKGWQNGRLADSGKRGGREAGGEVHRPRVCAAQLRSSRQGWSCESTTPDAGRRTDMVWCWAGRPLRMNYSCPVCMYMSHSTQRPAWECSLVPASKSAHRRRSCSLGRRNYMSTVDEWTPWLEASNNQPLNHDHGCSTPSRTQSRHVRSPPSPMALLAVRPVWPAFFVSSTLPLQVPSEGTSTISPRTPHGTGGTQEDGTRDSGGTLHNCMQEGSMNSRLHSKHDMFIDDSICTTRLIIRVNDAMLLL